MLTDATAMDHLILKAFSYGMIGVFASGVAMTVVGSANVLLGL